jgi:hypothetical protein
MSRTATNQATKNGNKCKFETNNFHKLKTS